MFELMDAYNQSAVIKVLGVGGAGCNAVDHMVESGIEGVDFACLNTDSQVLSKSKVKTTLQIGSGITKGLGAARILKSAVRQRWKIVIASSS